MRRLLIDTNIYSNAMLGTTEVVSELQRTEEIGISAVSIGELLSGITGGNSKLAGQAEFGRIVNPNVGGDNTKNETKKNHPAIRL